MLRISIETIPHNAQRYETVGDWNYEKIVVPERLEINVSEMQSEDSEFLVAVHELIEAWLCKKAGITAEQVDQWDMNYKGTCEEPGDDPGCPYREQHSFAEYIERIICTKLNLAWQQHERNIDAL